VKCGFMETMFERGRFWGEGMQSLKRKLKAFSIPFTGRGIESCIPKKLSISCCGVVSGLQSGCASSPNDGTRAKASSVDMGCPTVEETGRDVGVGECVPTEFDTEEEEFPLVASCHSRAGLLASDEWWLECPRMDFLQSITMCPYSWHLLQWKGTPS
jgi:hypothetical protein